MPTIAEVQKLLEDKTKALQKVIPAIAKQDLLVKGLVKQVAALEGTLKKTPKDKGAIEAVKKAQAALKIEETKLENLETSRESGQAAVATLNQRLRALTAFVESREGFLKWWDKEEGKMMQLLDQTQELAGEAEEESKKAETAIKGGNLQAATTAAAAAKTAATKAAGKADAADKLYDGWNGTWTEQRNLKSSELPKADVDSYAGVTKKVYEIFRQGKMLLDSVNKFNVEAGKSAAAAAEFVADGGDMAATYGKMLDATALSMQAIYDKLTNMIAITWGKIIMEDGKKFKEMRTNFLANKDGMRVAATKMVEQAGPLIAGYLTSSEKALANLESQSSKTLARVGRGFQVQLRDKISAVQKILADARRTVDSFKGHYEKAIVEFEALENAID